MVHFVPKRIKLRIYSGRKKLRSKRDHFGHFPQKTSVFVLRGYAGIHNLFRESLICFAKSLFFAHSLFFRPLTISHAYSISFSRIYCHFREFTICFANPLSVSRIRYLFHEFTICFKNSLSVSRIHYLFREFTIYFANPLSVFSLSRYMMTQIKRDAYYVTLCLRNSLNDSYESYN